MLEQAQEFGVRDVLIEDKASGTQLLQDLRNDGLNGVRPYQSKEDKKVRMNNVTATIENGFVYLPDKASWLQDFLHEISVSQGQVRRSGRLPVAGTGLAHEHLLQDKRDPRFYKRLNERD